jgi:hypothetical protein
MTLNFGYVCPHAFSTGSAPDEGEGRQPHRVAVVSVEATRMQRIIIGNHISEVKIETNKFVLTSPCANMAIAREPRVKVRET